MGILQDVYGEKQPKGYPGMPGTTQDKNDITRTCETVAGLSFGVPVARGAADLTTKLPTNVADKLLGITLRDTSRPPKDGDKYAKGANVTIRTKGDVWVKVGVAVTAGDPVFFDMATNLFTNVNPGNANLVLVGWVFDTSALANDVALAVRR